MHIQATYRLTLYVVTGKRKEMGYKHQELVKILQENPHSDSIKKNAIEKSVRYNLHQINQPTWGKPSSTRKQKSIKLYHVESFICR